MTVKELAEKAGVRYTTLVETTTGRCAGHQLIPTVRRFMATYPQNGSGGGQMKTVKDIFYFVEDVMTITGLSRSKSYKIIADLNRELSDRGYCVIPGRIAKSYFHERYCYTQEVAAKAAARQTRAAKTA